MHTFLPSASPNFPDSVHETDIALVQEHFPDFTEEETTFLILYADMRRTSIRHHLELMKAVA